jgi:hypothetical protein
VVRKWLPIGVATITGVLVLLGYFIPGFATLPYLGRAVPLRDVLVEWAVILGAFALILGALSILRVHGSRVVEARRGWFNSLVLLIVALLGIIPGLLGPQSVPAQMAWKYVLGPAGAALAALVVFTLTLAAFRLLRTRFSLWAVLFLVVVGVALLGSVPLVGLGWLTSVRSWLVNVPGMAGMRGLLLGVALGTIVMAVRVLLASERPHSES